MTITSKDIPITVDSSTCGKSHRVHVEDGLADIPVHELGVADVAAPTHADGAVLPAHPEAPSELTL